MARIKKRKTSTNNSSSSKMSPSERKGMGDTLRQIREISNKQRKAYKHVQLLELLIQRMEARLKKMKPKSCIAYLTKQELMTYTGIRCMFLEYYERSGVKLMELLKFSEGRLEEYGNR